jgi:hypothetical protein
MVCFSAKLKGRCAKFLYFMGTIISIIGIVVCTYGYMALGET